jgi:hypothetical protein
MMGKQQTAEADHGCREAQGHRHRRTGREQISGGNIFPTMLEVHAAIDTDGNEHGDGEEVG